MNDWIQNHEFLVDCLFISVLILLVYLAARYGADSPDDDGIDWDVFD